MNRVTRTLTLLAFFPLTVACKHEPAAEVETTSAPESPEKEADPKKDKAEAKTEAKAEGKTESKAESKTEAKVFGVPFIEGSDPLSLTREFFRDVAADNKRYMQAHDASFFSTFAVEQKPRATVVSCADSRVQSSAFDATAENDDFFVRNIGNQIANAEGSVEYGVEHLHTPVLLILGHTGCGAVKAAMNGYAGESDAMRHELDAIHVPTRKDGVKDDEIKAWVAAVVDNVNDQVAIAIDKFHDPLSRNTLTVVGAVLDFRNDMKLGAGKVVIVNVNGVTETSKVQAFVKRVTVVEEAPKLLEPATPSHAREPQMALASLGELREVLAKIPAVRDAAKADAHSIVASPSPEPSPK